MLAWAALITTIATYYTAIATHLTWRLWPTTSGGFVFNSQLRSLLDGRLDIDPRVIGMEGFVRDGLTYTYFGVLPALLRLPLVDQLWRDWTTLSCVAASTVASTALLLACRQLDDAPWSVPGVPPVPLAFGLTAVFSGPQLELLGKPSVYVEAITWSYAFACAFLCLAVPIIFRGVRPTAQHLAGLGLCSALALLTRVSTGIALYCALGALALALLLDRRQHMSVRRLLPAAAVLGLGVLGCAAVNEQRWGSPWQFADLSANHYYRTDESRLTRLETLGAFNLERVPDALRYYFSPSGFFDPALDSVDRRRIQRLFDGPEGPPTSLLLTMPLWWLLGLGGLHAVMSPKNTGLATRLAATGAGLLVAPALMTCYLYLAFRYRAEFAPTMLLFALAGMRQLGMAGRGIPIYALALALSAGQILQSHRALRDHACSPFGSWRPSAVEGCRFIDTLDARTGGELTSGAR
jgi:hypothetical protein